MHPLGRRKLTQFSLWERTTSERGKWGGKKREKIPVKKEAVLLSPSMKKELTLFYLHSCGLTFLPSPFIPSFLFHHAKELSTHAGSDTQHKLSSQKENKYRGVCKLMCSSSLAQHEEPWQEHIGSASHTSHGERKKNSGFLHSLPSVSSGPLYFSSAAALIVHAHLFYTVPWQECPKHYMNIYIQYIYCLGWRGVWKCRAKESNTVVDSP